MNGIMKIFFQKTVLVSVVTLLLTAPFAMAASSDPAAGDRLDQLISEALANNSELKAEKARWQSFERKVLPAGSLKDPQLSFAFMNYPVDSLADDETPMTGKEIRLTQMFPFPGKLGTREEIAKSQALWYRHAYEDARLKLAEKVKNAYYQLYYFDRAIAITETNLELLDDFNRVVESRYAVGKGLQVDVLKAQVERSKLMDQLFGLRQNRKTTQARLNYLLNRPSGTEVGTIEELPPNGIEQSLESLQKLSEDRRPLSDGYRSLIEQFRMQRKLAKLDYRPDFTLWAGYRLREDIPGDPVRGEDFVSGGISLNLPIYTAKRSESVAEANELVEMARQKFDNFRRQVYFNLHDAYVQMEKNRDLVELFKTGIVPQAEQTFQATLSAYQVDKVDFLTLLDALMKLYRYEMNYYQAVSDYQRNMARLEAEAGLDAEKWVQQDHHE